MSETFTYDYSFARPDPAAMKASGAAGVVRYLAPFPNVKNLSTAERDRLLEAGLSITLIWESVAQRAAKSGYDGGLADGLAAVSMAEGLEVPAGATLYYCLEDPTVLPRAAWPAVFEYARGVVDAGGPYERGGYGSQLLIEAALEQGLISRGWQVEGWSKGPSPVCHLYQRSNSRQHPFDGTDENVCLQSDWGQWPRPAAAAAPAVQEDDLVATLKRTPDGKVWVVSAAGRWHVQDAGYELPFVEWNIIHGADIEAITDEHLKAFLAIPQIGA